jgi:predicted nucleotidyltransferase
MRAVKSDRDNKGDEEGPIVSRAPGKGSTQGPDQIDRFNRVLGDTVEALEEAGIKYVFIGGIASGSIGRPRSTRDVDIFVQPEDAELVLRALAKHGYDTEKTDPTWLFKGWKEGVLVDVIFKSKGEIYLDAEMYKRAITAEFHGRLLKLVAPEDLLIIKAAAHSELTPGHWHDAVALLSHATLDWDYLLKRARRAPRRTLSLLLYAQSNDVWVPNTFIHQLYGNVFGEARPRPSESLQQVPLQTRDSKSAAPAPKHEMHEYKVAHLRERLAEDERTHELDIQLEYSSGKLLLRGEVPVSERRAAVEQVAREHMPGVTVENQIRVMEVCGPVGQEEMKER